MSIDGVDPEVQRLVRVAVESEERLEVLLFLRRERSKSFTAKALRGMLPKGGAGIDTHLAVLCGRGFLGVTLGNDLAYTYRPISTKIEHQVDELARLWSAERAAVEAMLRKPVEPSPASAFADAFRFRKREDDDG